MSPASRRVRRTTTLALAAGALTLLSSSTLPGALAAAGGDDARSPGSVDVVNTETVQAFLDPDGAVSSTRVYEQLVLTGKGRASLENPISTSGLRNLDGFGGWSADGGSQRLDLEVDGVERLRTVSDFDGDLPVGVQVAYRLDGERVAPADVVGASGLLEVTYTVRNSTGREQEVEVPDGEGGTTTRVTEVAVPMVASLETTLPASFTEVTSEGATMAGDGRGGMLVRHTLTLFPPVGAAEADVTWSAQVTDGVVPAAKITALPINPFDNPTLRKASDSYTAGAETGETLAAGATEIDANLLKLRDGAGELLAGLVQLSDGADRLAAGLVDEAAPGSRRLADGAGELSAGLGRLDDGAGRLADGAGELSGGAARAAQGSRDLTEGLGRISGGLDRLADVEGLPAATAGVEQLRAGVALLEQKIGTVDDPTTLVGGLHALVTGLGAAEAGAGQLAAGIDHLLRGSAGDLADPTDGNGLAKAQNAVDVVAAQLGAATRDGTFTQLVQGLAAAKATCGAGNTACTGALDALVGNFSAYGTASVSKLQAAAGGLGLVSSGLGDALATLTVPGSCADVPAGSPHLRCGVAALADGIAVATAGARELKAGAVALRHAGMGQLAGGLDELAAGLTEAVSGVLRLSAGAGTAYAGSAELRDGLGLLDDGAGRLAAGSGELADGATTASDGSQLLAAGADELADGLGAAADGSGRLAAGLEEAAAGAPKLQDGAQRLSTEGMSKLVAAGQDTAQDYGLLAATIAAGAERADAEKMAYGAPEGAQGLTAYSLELVADTGDDRRTVVRATGAVLVLAMALGSLALRRRFLPA